MNAAQLLEALRIAEAGHADPENSFTGPEIRRAMKWGPTRFAREMVALKAEGHIGLVPVHRVATDGRTMTIMGYQILP